MRILVIGGTKFIGPRLVRRLVADGHDVSVFHRGQTKANLPPGVRELIGDRRRLPDHAAELRRLGPDVVVDMIAYTEQDALAVVATFRGVAGRLVAISSGDVYRAYGIFTGLEPGPPEPTPIPEDAPLRQTLYIARSNTKPGDDLYDYEKILVERVVMGDGELPGTVLRLPMVHGPSDEQHRLAAYLKRMLAGRPAILLSERLARWRCLRGYVDDVAAAIALAATNPAAAGRIYNVADAVAFTEAEWVADIGKAFGWAGKIVTVPDASMPVPFNTAQDLVVDSARVRSELGYREVVGRADALRETIAWEREHMPEMAVDYAREDKLLVEFGGRTGTDSMS
jgi:nucleoside-diphosphate-sugar epimerase